MYGKLIQVVSESPAEERKLQSGEHNRAYVPSIVIQARSDHRFVSRSTWSEPSDRQHLRDREQVVEGAVRVDMIRHCFLWVVGVCLEKLSRGRFIYLVQWEFAPHVTRWNLSATTTTSNASLLK